MPLLEQPMLVLHLFPLTSFGSGLTMALSSADIECQRANLCPIGSGANHYRFNVDGL